MMKMITVRRPNTLRGALSDFDRYFESFFGDSHFSSAMGHFARLPAVDVRESDNAYVMELELPGYAPEDVEINVDGSSLSISSAGEEAKEEKDEGTWLLRERRQAGFSRSFKMPDNSDPEGISAGFKNGVLRLEIKKRPEAQKRSIKIAAE
ncbi:MAG: Hsp20/alpha crystallin family protein [Treponema sp.]|nr:Hsp20/alpha crystallin family protein [Treponema sp.]